MEQNNIDVSQDYEEVDTSEHSETSSDNSSVKKSYCSICLETEEMNIKYIKFPCHHVFHVSCFETYFQYNVIHTPRKENIECPICRKQFSTNTLKSVFNISRENPNENITILIPSRDENTVTEIHSEPNQLRRCTTADAFVIFILLMFITMYLIVLYKNT